MSTSQYANLLAHILNLEATGADISAYPDAEELVRTWGAMPYDIGALVSRVREDAPPGYIVPFVSKPTHMRLIIAKSTGRLTALAIAGIMFDMKYIRSRSKRLSGNLRNYAVAYPVGTDMHDIAMEAAEALHNPVRSPRHWGIVQILDNAIRLMPRMAGRMAAAERAYLVAEATRLTA